MGLEPFQETRPRQENLALTSEGPHSSWPGQGLLGCPVLAKTKMKIFLKFQLKPLLKILFFGIVVFALSFSSAFASTIYTGTAVSQIVTPGATPLSFHTIDFLGTTVPMGSIVVSHTTSGAGGGSPEAYIEVQRNGIFIATSTAQSYNNASCSSPSQCDINFSFPAGQRVSLTNGDKLYIHALGSGVAEFRVNANQIVLSSVLSDTVSVVLTLPSANQNLAGMPSHFQVTATTGALGFCGKPKVSYYASGTIVYYATGPGICVAPSSTYLFYAQEQSGVPIMGAVTSTPQIVDVQGNVLYSGSQITFYSNNPSTYYTGPVDSNGNPIFTSSQVDLEDDFFATSSDRTIDCSAYRVSLFSSSTLAGLGCILKSTLFDWGQSLFIPQDTTVARFSDLGLEEKAPFAYFYDIEEVFSTENSSSTGAFPSLSLELFPSSTLAWTVHADFSSSTVSSMVGTSNILLFRSLMTFALYFAFLWNAYYIARTIFDNKNIS